MDRLNEYRAILSRIVHDYASLQSPSSQIRSEVVIDRTADHFEVLDIGWDKHRRVHNSIVHLDIIDRKIWVQRDATNRPVVDELEAAGVPREDIVLAFHSPERRKLTGYAVG